MISLSPLPIYNSDFQINNYILKKKRIGVGKIAYLANPLPFSSSIPYMHQFLFYLLHLLSSPLLMSWGQRWMLQVLGTLKPRGEAQKKSWLLAIFFFFWQFGERTSRWKIFLYLVLCNLHFQLKNNK